MTTNQKPLFTRRPSRLAAALLAGLGVALTLTPARAADVSLLASDAFAASGFTSGTNWSDGLVPSGGKSYVVSNGRSLRTPDASPNAFTFAGAGATLSLLGSTASQPSLSMKGSNVITVPSLVLSNGVVINNGTSVSPDIARIAGSINVVNNGFLKSGDPNRTLVVTATLSGTNGLTLSDRGFLQLIGSHSYNGPLNETGVRVDMDSTFSMTPSSLTVGNDSTLISSSTVYNTTNVVAAGGNLNVNGGLDGVLRVGIRRLANTNNVVSALLDVSKQSQFTANVGNVIVGQNQPTVANGGANCVGTLLLATNNSITATNFLIGDSGNHGSGGVNTVTLGTGSNYLNTSILTVGGRKLPALMTLPSGGILVLTNNGVISGRANVNVSDNFANTSATPSSTLNLSGGTVIASLDQLTVGRKNFTSVAGTGGATGTLTLSSNAANRVDAIAITLGYMAFDTDPSTGIATGTLTVGGGSVFVKDVTLGYLDFPGAGNSVGNLNINGGTFNVTNNVTGSGGTANLNVNGGLLNLVNNGSVSVNNLVVSGTVTNASSITTMTLGGSGSIVGSGTTTASGSVSPGTSTTAGTLSMNSLTLTASAVLTYNLAATTTVGGGVNDFLDVTGDLALGNATLNLKPLAGGLAVGTYRLANYTGTAYPNVTFPASRYTLELATDTSTTPHHLNLTVAGGNPFGLRWTAANDAAWDMGGTTNWVRLGTSQQDMFFDADSVLFDDTAINTAVMLDVPVLPGSVTFSNTTVYTLWGAGKISGDTGLTKQGSGSLTVSTANDFDGPVSLSAGLLVAGNIAALGSINGGTTIASGATLDVNALSLGGEQVTVEGVGYDGNGAIVNNSANTIIGLQYVTLSGPTTLGGNFRWDIAGNGTPGSALLNGGACTLTKTGTNTVAIRDGVALTVGDIVVNQGMLILGQSCMPNPGYPVTVEPGATLQLFAQAVPLTRDISLVNGGILQASGGGVSARVTGTVTLNTQGRFDLGGTGSDLTLAGPVTGTGDMVVSGYKPAVLSSLANNWIGGLIISNPGCLSVGDGATSIGSLPAALSVITTYGTLRWNPPPGVTITPSQDVVGTGIIEKLSDGILALNHTYSWTGGFNSGNSSTSGGITRLLHPCGFGDGSASKIVAVTRGEVRLEGGITVPAGIAFRTSGYAAMSAPGTGLAPLRNVAGTNTVAGPVEAFNGVGDSEYTSDAGLLQLNGPVFLGTNTARAAYFSGAGNGVVNGPITNGSNALSVRKQGTGTWTFTAANSYKGTTSIEGGTLLVNGSLSTNKVTVQSSGTLGGSGTIGGPVTFTNGSHALLTLGSPLTLSTSLIVSDGADVHLNLSNNVPAGSYTLATYNAAGSSGAFASTPIIDSGSLAGTGAIVTSGGTVVLQVIAGPSTPPNFPPGAVTRLSDGNFSLTGTGAVGTPYRLWASTNVALPMTSWTVLSSNTIVSSPFTNLDLMATNYPRRFYQFSTP